MSQYRIENRTRGTEDLCESLDDCLEIASEYPDDDYVVYELCRDNEYKIDFDYDKYK